MAYLLVVALSALSQAFVWPGFGAAEDAAVASEGDEGSSGVQVASIPAMTADGSVADDRDPERAHLRIAYRVRTPEGTLTGIGASASTPSASLPTVVLLHGSPGSMRDFTHFAPALAEHYRVIEVDLPGFGRSDRRAPDYGIRAHARGVLALLDHLKVERAHFLGFSMGSGVAFNIADLAPERVSSLTLYGGIGLQEAEGSGDYHFEHLKYRIGYGLLVLAPDLVPHFGLLGDRTLRRSFIRNFMDSDQRPLREVMRRLDAPVLIVHGAKDILVPAWGAEAHHELIRHSRLVMFGDEGHFMLFNEQESIRLAKVVAPFIAEVESEGVAGISRWSITFRDPVAAATPVTDPVSVTPPAPLPADPRERAGASPRSGTANAGDPGATGAPAVAEARADVDPDADADGEATAAIAEEVIVALEPAVVEAQVAEADREDPATPGRTLQPDQLAIIVRDLAPELIVTRLAVARYDTSQSGAGPAPTTTEGLPSQIHIERGMSPWLQMVAIAVATFVSEDLTCITAGLLVRNAQLDLAVAVLGCMLGIFVGDIGLWAIGRIFGRRLLAWPWIGQRIPLRRLERLGGFIDTHVGKAVLISRFLPGTRMPMYLAAGMLGRKSWQFFFWFVVAVFVWVPLVLALVIIVGDAAVAHLERFFGSGWISLVLAVALMFVLLRTLEFASTSIGRARLIALVSRLWRWEFWPSYIMYIPVVPWILYLSWRHRGFNTITAANPAIPHGGFVGESKFEILSRLPADGVVRSGLIPASPDIAHRLQVVHALLLQLDLAFPVVFKPDVGERGSSVKLVRDIDDAAAYLGDNPEPILLQEYHPGPNEAGVFYVRHPHEERGRIYSITHKEFSYIEGDGERTFEQLIWQHERYRMQAKKFLRRHADRLDEVVPRGEKIRLAFAGNHCQGTKFFDGEHLKSPELEARFDAIMKAFPGFYFGRADVRYTSPEEFRAGRGFAIVELNGITSESTNIYDPARGLMPAWRTMREKWRMLFEIGSANRLKGAPVSRHADLLRQVYRHLFIRDVDPLSD